MPPSRFLSIFRPSPCKPAFDDDALLRHITLPWIASPIDNDQDPPRLYRHPDSTPIELFFDLFFVANLSTFTDTHEINNIKVLGEYVGFLGVIWFTWLQVTLFDIRFARDSIFERICKAIQLGAMVGFASAGTRFTTRMHQDNIWVFQSLSLILAGSRMVLAIQYAINVGFLYGRFRTAAKGIAVTAAILWTTSLLYLGMYFVFSNAHLFHTRIWTVWFILFGAEMWAVMGVSCISPGIEFQDTHLNVRMGLLTLIIIGEGVISVTRIVNKTVRPGGWTKWSFVHILGVTTNVYLLWQAYFDLSARGKMRKRAQHAWAQLHFPFHVALILLLEGSQILALTLDVTLKLKYLGETIQFACEEPRPDPNKAVGLIRSTIADMEIPFSRGATQEWAAISSLLDELAQNPLCHEPELRPNFLYSEDLINDLMGNVTAALFSSMGITPTVKGDISRLNNEELLQMYMKVLAFVYEYFFTVASLCMCLFAAFLALTRRHRQPLLLGLSIGTRILLAAFLASLVSFASHFSLAYAFMTSPHFSLTDFWTLWLPEEMHLTGEGGDVAHLKRRPPLQGMVRID
ncbi:uncharacterized protein PFLUO_LOCUS2069 [Penicillium psychrofluorescens]|uniref:uncharacterized protein n=1 Tax=Penicillium psychrofluorescens TaxID=3158075 RepID=UPI003CCE319C